MPELARPDLNGADPAIVAYIEALETELTRRRGIEPREDVGEIPAAEALEPAEPPTTLNVISVSATGLAKRTPRHLYGRQRRGGMGIFDLDVGEGDGPAMLTVADQADDLILLTSQARAFRLAVNHIPEAPVRARGASIVAELDLHPGETLAAVLPAGRGAAIALLTAKGYARVLPAHVVGPAMSPGTALLRPTELGPLTAACWTSGDGDLFVATERGLGIRFSERALPLQYGLAIRLEAGDRAVAVESVHPPDGEAIFLLGADGRGTLRLMAGFAANKAPGGGGKVALKTDHLIGAVAAGESDDLFIQSRLSKLIRFRANEVPAKEGVVQGVNCMALRADECVALTSHAIV